VEIVTKFATKYKNDAILRNVFLFSKLHFSFFSKKRKFSIFFCIYLIKEELIFLPVQKKIKKEKLLTHQFVIFSGKTRKNESKNRYVYFFCVFVGKRLILYFVKMENV